MRSFIFAFKGIKWVFRTERNAVWHFCIAILVIALSIFFKISRSEWLIVFLCIGMVFAAEMFNTAIEKLVDKISPERNETAGMIKDISAGAVLITAIISLVAGIIIFFPYLLKSVS